MIIDEVNKVYTPQIPKCVSCQQEEGSSIYGGLCRSCFYKGKNVPTLGEMAKK